MTLLICGHAASGRATLATALAPRPTVVLAWDTVEAALATATDGDVLLLVVSCPQGVPNEIVAVNGSAREWGVPQILVLTGADGPNADVEETFAVLGRVLEDDAVLLGVPVHADDGTIAGVLDLFHLSMTVPGEAPLPAEAVHRDAVSDARDDLVEALALAHPEDEGLAVAWAGGPLPSGHRLLERTVAALRAAELTVAVPVVAPTGVGLELLASLLPG